MRSSHPVRVATAILLAVLCLPGSAATQQPAGSSRPAATIPLPASIPLFPLPDVGLFPNILQPFTIFEPRYRTMIEDALQGDRIIGVVMLRPGFEAEYEGRPPVYAIGCAGLISEHELLPDGRHAVVLRGLVKFRILSEDQTRPYRLAEVEAIPETLDESGQAALREQRDRVVALLLKALPGASAPPPSISDVDVINTLAQLLPIQPGDRQVLLEKENPLARSQTILDLLALMR